MDQQEPDWSNVTTPTASPANYVEVGEATPLTSNHNNNSSSSSNNNNNNSSNTNNNNSNNNKRSLSKKKTPFFHGSSSSSSTPRQRDRRRARERPVTLVTITAATLSLVLCLCVLFVFLFGDRNNNNTINNNHNHGNGTNSSHLSNGTTSPTSTSAPSQQQQQQQQAPRQQQHQTPDSSFSTWQSASSSSSSSSQLHDEFGRFILEDYDVAPPFSDFLPALAGYYGKPLYGFYVNRGQGMAAFGIQSKDFPLLEFHSANKAYQNTPFLGFRTFLQIQDNDDTTNNNNNHSARRRRRRTTTTVEPFSPLTARHAQLQDNDDDDDDDDEDSSLQLLPRRRMFIGANEMQLQEIDVRHGVETNVTFLVLPEEDFGALVKHTTVRNVDTSKAALKLGILDGLARMEPAGGPLDYMLKNMGRTLEGWMGVYSPYTDSLQMPFYRLSTKPIDVASIEIQQAGHWCLAVLETTDTIDLLPIIFDTSKVFGQDTTLLRPVELHQRSIQEIIANPQYGLAKTSSALAALAEIKLQPGESVTITSYYGRAEHVLDVPVIARRLLQRGFARYKVSRSREIIDQITAFVQAHTSQPLLDQHVQQMFLDNSLRGGMANIFGAVDDDAGMRNINEDARLKVFHLFSRIHGDLERDYNNFNIAPTFFSQGPGNFRDVIQNRRNDVIFNPQVGSFNVDTFLSFIQADGYNPLTVQAVAFTITDFETCRRIATRSVGEADGHRAQREALTGILNGGPFRPGQLFQLMEDQNIELIITRQDFIDTVAAAAEYHPMAKFDKGYWADHWSYILDLIENFLAVFPDWEYRLLFNHKLPYFFSPASVQPRRKKYVEVPNLDGNGLHIQQWNATLLDDEKIEYKQQYKNVKTGWYSIEANWQHATDGSIFRTSVIGKLVVVATLKFASRDPLGLGIEYEAGRPGWNDANNGLPGILGSGLPETIELASLLRYIKRACTTHKKDVIVPQELAELMDAVDTALGQFAVESVNVTFAAGMTVPDEHFRYWDAVSTARETYRNKTKFFFSGAVHTYNWEFVVATAERWLGKIDHALACARQIGSSGVNGTSGITPTYFAYDVVDWERTGGLNVDGHPLVFPLEMRVRILPLFLEGPTRMFKLLDAPAARDLYGKVKNSVLRDQELKMYTISASLKDENYDVGREMAFAPGWLENQSVWMHLSYKFYLELLRHEMFDEFFQEMTEGGMLPFMDPKVYGRSLMECSSFIASSAFEDPAVRGRGFEARLTGATAEFMSMWILLMIGPNPFYVAPENGELRMELIPAIPRWLFREDDSGAILSFKLFGAIDVRYFHRKGDDDLFRVPPTRYQVILRDGQSIEVDGRYIGAPLSDKIRRVVFVSSIDVYFE